jgi:pimeloyl-ACP methyl ester carboxylesterase
MAMTTSHPVRSRTVPVAGATVSLRESGDPAGPAAVPLHGGSSSAATWDRLATALTAAGHHVIAADLRGHGSSARTRDYPLHGSSDDIRDLLDALEIGSAALVGHSLGGYAASVVGPARTRTHRDCGRAGNAYRRYHERCGCVTCVGPRRAPRHVGRARPSRRQDRRRRCDAGDPRSAAAVTAQSAAQYFDPRAQASCKSCESRYRAATTRGSSASTPA